MGCARRVVSKGWEIGIRGGREGARAHEAQQQGALARVVDRRPGLGRLRAGKGGELAPWCASWLAKARLRRERHHLRLPGLLLLLLLLLLLRLLLLLLLLRLLLLLLLLLLHLHRPGVAGSRCTRVRVELAARARAPHGDLAHARRARIARSAPLHMLPSPLCPLVQSPQLGEQALQELAFGAAPGCQGRGLPCPLPAGGLVERLDAGGDVPD